MVGDLVELLVPAPHGEERARLVDRHHVVLAAVEHSAVRDDLGRMESALTEIDVFISIAKMKCHTTTGVRAGSLDQATEQKGRPGEGTLIEARLPL